jgi:hypothetical protein
LTIHAQKYTNINVHQIGLGDSNSLKTEKHEAQGKIECIKRSDLATSQKWLAQVTAFSGRM